MLLNLNFAGAVNKNMDVKLGKVYFLKQYKKTKHKTLTIFNKLIVTKVSHHLGNKEFGWKRDLDGYCFFIEDDNDLTTDKYIMDVQDKYIMDVQDSILIQIPHFRWWCCNKGRSNTLVKQSSLEIFNILAHKFYPNKRYYCPSTDNKESFYAYSTLLKMLHKHEIEYKFTWIMNQKENALYFTKDIGIIVNKEYKSLIATWRLGV